jgi:hypothetical protein
MKRRWVTASDLMQDGYVYALTAPAGRDFDPSFKPDLMPGQMLRLGIFGGKYMTDCMDEFPVEWFDGARLCHERHNPALNCFGVNASLPLSVWRKKGWIHHDDPRGWFQWYCRYYVGRRCPDDERQIGRWRAIRRHVAQIRRNCPEKDLDCRRRQRQAVLHWAYDGRNI